jgi:enoyl-[acyl-carrier protein] reductase II
VKFAQKAETAGVDAVVAEGFEAGGHNGREETTTFALIPMVCKSVSIPVIAAGGIATGRAMLAAMTLGAHGVQIGSRFVASTESSAHEAFKNLVVSAQEGSTKLTLKELTPVRLLKNKFFNELMDLYKNNPTSDELKAHLGRGRAKKGMFEGDLDEGELEIGQIAAVIDDILPVSEIVKNLVKEFNSAAAEISNLTLE